MRESLIKINSKRLSKAIEKATGSKLKAILTGMFTTVLIQSSSGVTAIVVAFMSANLLSFSQGVMIMIGANIGTTATAFIISLNIENYYLLLIVVGFIFNIIKNRKANIIGNATIGLGFIFLGLNLMNQAFTVYANSTWFLRATFWIANSSILGVLGGAGLSALIQSSSATIGIVQNLYMINAISLPAAISIMLGANIGTTIASLIVSVSATKPAKQAIHVNIIFNVLGGVIFLIFLIPFSKFLIFLEKYKFIIPNKRITIAYSHFIFNIISALIFCFMFFKTYQKHQEKEFDT